MTCSEVLPLLNAHLDDELSDLIDRAVLDHLRTCPSCRVWKNHLLWVQTCVRELPTDDSAIARDFSRRWQQQPTALRGNVAGTPGLLISAGLVGVLLFFVIMVPGHVKSAARTHARDGLASVAAPSHCATLDLCRAEFLCMSAAECGRPEALALVAR